MKTFSRLWQCLGESLEWKTVYTYLVAKIKTRILCSVTSFRKIVPFVTMAKTVVEPERTQMTIQSGACAV